MDTTTQTTTTVATAYNFQDMLEANLLSELKHEQSISDYTLKNPIRGTIVQATLLVSDVRRVISSVRRGMEIESYTDCFNAIQDSRVK